MSRRRLLLVILGIVLVLVVLAVVRPRTFYPFLPNGHTELMKTAYGHISLDVSLPEFNRPGVDTGIRALVTTQVFEPLATEAAQHEYSANTSDVATITYRVPYRTLRYAGIVIDVSIDSKEHPAHYVIVRTVDLWRDRVLSVADFSVSANNPLKRVLVIIQDRLGEREGIDPKRVDKVLRAEASVLSDFIADRDGLEFYFNPGMLAAAERGVIVVNVPWALVAHDLKP